LDRLPALCLNIAMLDTATPAPADAGLNPGDKG